MTDPSNVKPDAVAGVRALAH